MDGTRFDGFARALAQGTSRRTLLRLLGGSVAGVGAAGAVTDEAGAFICRQPGVLCAKDAHCCSGICGDDHRCACSEGLTRCRRDCVNLLTDPNHCGDCTTVCASGGCTQGSCCTPATNCPEGQNCGMADNGCGGTIPCGTCQAPETCGGGGTENVCGCTPRTSCPAGQICGPADDGCGGTIECGTCPANYDCIHGGCFEVTDSNGTDCSDTCSGVVYGFFDFYNIYCVSAPAASTPCTDNSECPMGQACADDTLECFAPC